MMTLPIQLGMAPWWSVPASMVPLLSLATGINAWYVKQTVRTEILTANTSQLALINGTYVRAMHSTVTGAEIERSQVASNAALIAIQADIKELILYTHTQVEELRGELRLMKLERELLTKTTITHVTEPLTAPLTAPAPSAQ